MFDSRIKQVDHSKLYRLLLKMVLSQADSFDLRHDYCQIRDDENNGWDVFYFGFANDKSFTKNCYVQSVNNGAHGETRIYFTEDDSKMIVNKIKESNCLNYSGTINFD